jgi:hypothetical protein
MLPHVHVFQPSWALIIHCTTLYPSHVIPHSFAHSVLVTHHSGFRLCPKQMKLVDGGAFCLSAA